MYKTAKRIVIFIIGLTVCLVGLAIAVLPGPGPIILVPLGLAILATEFAWAKFWLRKYKNASNSVWTEIKGRFGRRPGSAAVQSPPSEARQTSSQPSPPARTPEAGG